MKGPNSFTREDVVEIHSHSGFVVLDRVLSAVVNAGAALSGPGEFTKRAFLNGRIDLTQAEAVIDLINAPCERAAQMAGRQIAGGLRHVLDDLSTAILALLAKCEALIEFPETAQPETLFGEIQKRIKDAILPELSALIQKQKETAIYREGALLAIAGAPNVGKSSLLNKLVDKEAAIVSDFPGTTRDIVRDYISIRGVPVVLCDTAGIQDTNDPVESIGIQKARDHFQRADIILLVLEATRGLNCLEKKLVAEFKNTHTIAVINKDDLSVDSNPFDPDNMLKDLVQVRVSAKIGTGIDQLKALIFKALVVRTEGLVCDTATPNLRQRKILEKARQELQLCGMAAETIHPIEVVSEMLKRSLHLLEDISGNRNKEALYDHIFSQFCIGK